MAHTLSYVFFKLLATALKSIEGTFDGGGMASACSFVMRRFPGALLNPYPMSFGSTLGSSRVSSLTVIGFGV